jgi:hypothetical protein
MRLLLPLAMTVRGCLIDSVNRRRVFLHLFPAFFGSRQLSDFPQLREKGAGTPFDGQSGLIQDYMRTSRHGGYFSCGDFGFREGQFCQCLDSGNDLLRIQPATPGQIVANAPL